TILELHSRLTVANSKLSRYAVSHRSLQSFTDENLNFYIIYLCWHGAHTQFHRLKWLVDIALIINNNNINWPGLITLAQELKQQRALLVALNLCQRMYGCEVPVSLSTGFFQDAMVHFFVKRSLHRLELTALTGHSFVDQLKTLPDVFVSDSVWEGLQAFRTKFRINAFDIQFLPMLPARFCWLYTFAKPIALFRRHVLVGVNRNTKRRKESSSPAK
ncbi:MAG: nucleotidyltransferase family protein, partial [Photobacterium frigidiphilum]|uniref:nucleotidyltransferase family protein n=1 Tax=Photobacterium frigidiphilum TaxID=264736 RepID=UPI0030019B26